MSGKKRTTIGNSTLEKCEDEKTRMGKNQIKEREIYKRGMESGVDN